MLRLRLHSARLVGLLVLACFAPYVALAGEGNPCSSLFTAVQNQATSGGKRNAPLTNLVQEYRQSKRVNGHGEIGASFPQVLETFGLRAVKGPKTEFSRWVVSAPYSPDVVTVTYSSEKNSISFLLSKEMLDDIELHHKAELENLLSSLNGKMDRTRKFYLRLAKECDLDLTKVEDSGMRNITFYVQTGGKMNQTFADYSRTQIDMGYLMLLNDYGLVIAHESHHLMSKAAIAPLSTLNTPVSEGLANYFAAVSLSQTRIGNPVSSQVKNSLSLPTGPSWPVPGTDELPHPYGQYISGLLWKLRKSVNKIEGKPWDDVSYIDRLAVLAQKDFTKESIDRHMDLNEWITALLNEDQKLSGGRYTALIRKVGDQFLGTAPLAPK